jgi:hypothetical protein
MRIATMSGTKIRRPRSPRLRLMRIVLIKVTLELVKFRTKSRLVQKAPDGADPIFDVHDHLLLDHEMVGEGVHGKAGESADSDLWVWVIFCRVIWL